MQKGITQPLIILGIVIAAVVSTLFYSSIKKNYPLQNINFQKQQEKTYTNQILGFELKYSESLNLKEDSEEEFNKRGNGNFRKNFKGYVGYEPGKFLGGILVLEKEENFDTNPFTVWVFDNPDELSIDEWHHKFWYYPFVWGDFTAQGKFDLAPKEIATVSGQTGKSRMIDYQAGKPKFIYIPGNKKMYLFRVIGNSGNQILSAFNFLETKITTKDGCKIGGCSSQLCVEENDSGISTCEFLAEYACYKNAKCERQTDGKCGWTETSELTKCLQETRQ